MEAKQRNPSFSPLTHYERIINLPSTLSTVLLVLIGSSTLALVVLFFAKAASNIIISIALLSLISTALYFANLQGKHKVAAIGAFILTSILLTYNLSSYNGIYDVSLLAFPGVIVFSSLLLGYRSVVPITLFMVATLATVHRLSLLGIVTPYDGLLSSRSQEFWTIIAAMLITGALVFIIMSMIEQNVKKILDSENRLKQVYESTLKGWAKALELRDHETEGHSQRVTQMTLALAKKVGVSGDDLKSVRWGALLHDIGKMSVPDAVLLKPGRLSNEEFEFIKKHPLTAKILLDDIPYLRNALEIPYLHHEKWDGSGYPHGLKGEDIPLAARIFAVIDVWDALISERPYKRPWTEEESIRYIKAQSGKHFDPTIVSAFLDIIEEDDNSI